MKLHEREAIVQKATTELELALVKVIETHKLTGGEELRVVVSVLCGHLGLIAKYTIREERHGSADKPGGLE